MTPHWYRSLDPYTRRVFWTSCAGFSADSLNIQLYAFVLPTLLTLWGLSHAQAGLLASVALAASAAGGWIGGLVADRLGRARLLRMSMVWVAIAALACALSANFEQLLVARALQGFCFGGDLAVGAVFIGEIAAPHMRGRLAGTAQSGWAIGWALAALIATAALMALPIELAWRCTFIAGALPALGLFALRRPLRESDTFLASSGRASWRAIFASPTRTITFKGSLLATGMHGGYWAIATWWPTMLHTERGLSITGSSPYLAALISGAFGGYLFGAWLSDTAGRKAALTSFAIGGLFIALVYVEIPVSNFVLLLLSVPLGFVATGIFGVIGPILTELYPTELRGAGLGFCYNVGRGVAGGVTPVLVGAGVERFGVGHAMGLYVACAYGIVLVAALLLPETRGRALHNLSEANR